MKKGVKKIGGWSPDPDEITGAMSKKGQGSRTTGVGMDADAVGLSQTDGYETNYKGLPGYENHS